MSILILGPAALLLVAVLLRLRRPRPPDLDPLPTGDPAGPTKPTPTIESRRRSTSECTPNRKRPAFVT